LVILAYVPDMQKKTKPAVKQSGYKVLGTMEDGVRILMPHTKPTHFTMAEARDIMRGVRRGDKAAGHKRGAVGKSVGSK
jgi:hypothetical protein